MAFDRLFELRHLTFVDIHETPSLHLRTFSLFKKRFLLYELCNSCRVDAKAGHTGSDSESISQKFIKLYKVLYIV